MTKIICWFRGHIWEDWIWAELDYACRGCNRCKKVEWGATSKYKAKYLNTHSQKQFRTLTKQ